MSFEGCLLTTASTLHAVLTRITETHLESELGEEPSILSSFEFLLQQLFGTLHDMRI
jgi:hypothetical protein